jgi:ribonuclease HII
MSKSMSKSDSPEKIKQKRTRKPVIPLERNHDICNQFEIGVDEAGRGPMFGRLYVAAAVLPKHGFSHELMKDSKKFTNKEKLRETAEYIKQNAVAWNIQYIENDVIDKQNILKCVMLGMHEAIKQVISKLEQIPANIEPNNEYTRKIMLLIDGNYFTPHIVFDEDTQSVREIPFETIEGGDNKYTCIAAASILAKVAHDEYIADICEQYPILIERYGLDSHVGYGTKRHLDGIKEHGITQWHRRTFGSCKTAVYSPIE